MADMMTFPDTVEEFMEEYKLVDTEQVYTNGTELVPIFRMKQWFEHEKAQLFSESTTSDLISRTETVEHLRGVIDVTVPITDYDGGYVDGVEVGISTVSTMPPAQPETLTDKEQRIFLAAMGREEKVCRQVDDECRDCREPYEDSLVRTCHEIERKVKGALWT